MVGYILICHGAVDAICSICSSPIIKRVGRIPLFTFGAILNVAMLILLLYWRPSPDEIYLCFIIAAIWGMADAIWQTQINGRFFPKMNFCYFCTKSLKIVIRQQKYRPINKCNPFLLLNVLFK